MGDGDRFRSDRRGIAYGDKVGLEGAIAIRSEKRGYREVKVNSADYNAVYDLARQISDSLDPDKMGGAVGVVFQKKEPSSKAEDGFIDYSYRCVTRRTEKALLVEINSKRYWMAKSKVEFLPGNIIRIPKWLARSSKVLFHAKPVAPQDGPDE